jgi:hypothetical protein
LSLAEKIKKMNKWKLGVILVVLLFVLGAASHLIYFMTGEFPLTENERKMSEGVAREAISNMPVESKIYTPDKGWRLEAREGQKRVTYVTIQSQEFSAFVAIDLDKRKAVTVVENRDWAVDYLFLPQKLVGTFSEEREHKIFRAIGGIVLAIVIVLAFVLHSRWHSKKEV